MSETEFEAILDFSDMEDEYTGKLTVASTDARNPGVGDEIDVYTHNGDGLAEYTGYGKITNIHTRPSGGQVACVRMVEWYPVVLAA